MFNQAGLPDSLSPPALVQLPESRKSEQAAYGAVQNGSASAIVRVLTVLKTRSQNDLFMDFGLDGREAQFRSSEPEPHRPR